MSGQFPTLIVFGSAQYIAFALQHTSANLVKPQAPAKQKTSKEEKKPVEEKKQIVAKKTRPRNEPPLFDTLIRYLLPFLPNRDLRKWARINKRYRLLATLECDRRIQLVIAPQWAQLRQTLVGNVASIKSAEFETLEVAVRALPDANKMQFQVSAMEVRAFALLSFLVHKKALNLNEQARFTVKTMHAFMAGGASVAMEVEKTLARTAIEQAIYTPQLNFPKIGFLIKHGATFNKEADKLHFASKIVPKALDCLAASTSPSHAQSAVESKELVAADHQASQAACVDLIIYAWKKDLSIPNPINKLKTIFSQNKEQPQNLNIARLEIAFLAKKLKHYLPSTHAFSQPSNVPAVKEIMRKLSLLLTEDITATEVEELNAIKENLFVLAKTDARLATILRDLHKRYSIQFAPAAERSAEAAHSASSCL